MPPDEELEWIELVYSSSRNNVPYHGVTENIPIHLITLRSTWLSNMTDNEEVLTEVY